MSIIEQLDPVSFSNYLKKYHNTICGRHPIGVLLNVSNFLLENVTSSKMLTFVLNTELLEHSLVLKWQALNGFIFSSVLNLVSNFCVLHIDKRKLLKGLRVFSSLKEMRYHFPFEFQWNTIIHFLLVLDKQTNPSPWRSSYLIFQISAYRRIYFFFCIAVS